MTDEQILEHWDAVVPIPLHPLSMELAKIEGTLKGVATCLSEAGLAMSEYSGFGEDLRFFAQEVKIQAERIMALREKFYE